MLSAQSPQCVLSDPTFKLRSAVAMFYLAILAQFLCFQISYSAYKHETSTRRSPVGAIDQSEQSGSEMRALPLSTRDEDEEDPDFVAHV